MKRMLGKMFRAVAAARGVGVVVLAVVLAVAAGGAEPERGKPAAGKAERAASGIPESGPDGREGLDKLLVGHLPVTGHAKFFVAKEYGLFEEEGLDVELIAYANSADGLAALRADKLDVGAFGTVAPLVYIAARADMRLIGGLMGEDAYIVARPDRAAGFGEIGDLRGKRVATVRFASGALVFLGALRQAGLSWKDDLTVVELSNPVAVLDAVENGQVDAGVVWGPHDLAAAPRGLRVVFATADMFPGHPCCRLVVTSSRLAAKASLWPRFLRAILRAEHFVKEPVNRAPTIAAIARYLPLDTAAIERSFFHGRIDQASDPNETGVKRIWDIMVASEYIHSKDDPARYIDHVPYRAALRSLLEAEPGEPFWHHLAEEYDRRNPSSAEAWPAAGQPR